MDIPCLLNNTSPFSDPVLAYLTDEQGRALEFLENACQIMLDEHLTIIELEGSHYLIGIQLAKLIKSETSNMYRALKRMGFNTRRATPDQIHWINTLRLPLVGVTHSITFIKLQEALSYLINRNVETAFCIHCNTLLV